MKTFTIILILFIMAGSTYGQQRNPGEFNAQDKANLLRLAEETQKRMEAQKAEAVRVAKQKGWLIESKGGNGYMELMRIDQSGIPEYYKTFNRNAAKTSETDHLWPGGLTGLDLTGDGMLIGEWDGAGVRTTHQEFNDGGAGRVIQKDAPGFTHYHSTHVAGTLVAEGENSDAHGMAPEATLHAYDWDNDVAEMLTAVANDDLIISNHSYGFGRGWDYESDEAAWYWRGNLSISETEDYKFGFYGEDAHDWDDVAHNAPQYLICKSAGNERDDDHNGAHKVFSGGSWVWSNDPRDPDGGDDGYDCIGNIGVAKNLLSIGAVWDIPGGYSSPADVVLEDYSSFGPTDDGRIKPDIVANGDDLTSASNTGDGHYIVVGGTSMSAPTTTGTLTLIQDYYNDFRGGFMNAAVLKGLAINTAHECGPNDGPDYRHGWGLLNATGMADLVTRDHEEGGLIVEGKLLNMQPIDYTYYCDGSSDINVTLSWNDPPHAALTPALNPNTLTIVNDLNLRILDSPSSAFYPWVLDPASPASAATTGNNIRDNVETINIQNPAEGYYTVRINHWSTLQDGEQTYALIINGMTTPVTENYCESQHANWDSYEYIQNVSFGDIDNSSGRSPGGYGNYTGLVTEMDPGSSQTIDVAVNGYAGDRAAVFVDWNQDGDFEDTGEEFSMGTGSGPFSTTITVPDDAVIGYTTMRVVLCYNTAPTPCSSSAYGETEDYTINVGADINVWTGAVSNSWDNSNNWSQGHQPYLSEDVVITTDGFYPPVISGSQEACRDILIEADAGVEVGDGVLSIFGDAYIHGDLSLTSTYADVFIYGDVVWYEGSTGSMTGSATIDCEGDWDFNEGADVQFTAGYVEFSGDQVSWIRSNEENCQINHLRNYKSGSYYLGISAQSTADFSMSGSFYNYAGSNFKCLANQKLIIDDYFNNMGGSFEFYSGALQFDGNPSIPLKPNDGDFLHDLIINTTAPLQLADDYTNILNIGGDLEIIGGTFAPGNFHVYVTGNWTNSVGTTGFNDAWSNVIFNGPGNQFIYGDEDFNMLNLNNGGKLYLTSYHVSCNKYDWTTGGIDVSTGSFTALDLEDEGIFGAYAVGAQGEINLTNDGYVDLRGEVKVFGGTFNATGTISWWPYNDDALLWMTDGIIDFKTCGISIKDNANDFDVNITGGRIRTVGNFINERTEVDLSQVDLEMYGSGSHALELAGNNTLNNFEINKLETDGNPEIKPTDRNGNPFPESGKATQVNLTSDVILSNLDLTSGSFYLNGHEMTVDHNFTVFAGGAFYMDNPADVLNVAETAYDKYTLKSGSETLLSDGIVNLGGWIRPMFGCSFTATINNTINLLLPTGASYGAGLSNHEPSATYGNVVVDSDNKRKFLDGDATQPIVINGDLTINPDNMLETQNNTLIVHGNIVDFPSSTIRVYKLITKGNFQHGIINHSEKNSNSKPLRAGYVELDNFLEIKGNLDIGNGSVLAHDFFEVTGTGSMLIDGGSFICDVPYGETKAWNNIHGNFEMSDGLFEVSNNSPRFSPSSTSTIMGGIIRSGGGFMAEAGADFNPEGGTLEMTAQIENANLYCFPGNTLYNLHINAPEGHTVHYVTDIYLQKDLTIDSGSLECGYDETYVLNIVGNWTDNSGGFIANQGTVKFRSGYNSTIYTNETFYNLCISVWYPLWDHVYLSPSISVIVLNDLEIQDGNFHLSNNNTLDIHGDVKIYEDALFSAFNDINVEIFVGGNWTNDNSENIYGVGFNEDTETITFNGEGDQFISTAADMESFANLVVDKPSGEFKPNGNINVKGDLLIENGQWKDNNTGLTHYFEGDFTVVDGGIYNTVLTENTTVFKGSDNQLLDLNMNGYFCNVIIDKTDWADGKTPAQPENNSGRWAYTVTLMSDADLEYGDGLTIETGTLVLNGHTLYTMGNIEINNEGKLVLEGGSQLHLEPDDVLHVNEGGILHLEGSPTENPLITHRSDGYYGLEVMDGGIIRAVDATFEFVGTNWYGIHIREGAFIDPSYAFTNCTFQNGNPDITDGSLLSLNNGQNLTITGASFPDESADYNVGKDTDIGQFTFVDYTGDFSGEAFEFDLHNRIDWYTPTLEAYPFEITVPAPAGTTSFEITSNLDWTAAASSDWFSVTPQTGSGNQTITITYDANTFLDQRSGEITLSAPEVDDFVVTLNQEGAEPILIVSPAEHNVNHEAGMVIFNVTSNTNWTATEEETWFNLTPGSGTGNGTIQVDYDENPSTSGRSGEINISVAGLPTIEVYVNQSGADTYLTVSPSSQTAGPDAGYFTFNVLSNIDWLATSAAEWLTVFPASGSGDGMFDVDFEQNATGAPRTAEIWVTEDGGGLSQTVTLTQSSYPSHSISLPAGWVGLSSFLQPADNNLDVIFNPILPNLVIAQTLSGIYYPAGPVNTIGAWWSQSAYGVKMDASATLTLVGTEETNKSVFLPVGWSLLPVVVNQPVAVSSVLAGLDFAIVKSLAGMGVYWPAMNINTIGNLNPGLAYYILMNAAGSVTFPPNTDGDLPFEILPQKLPGNPWNEIQTTVSSHLIAIEGDALQGITIGDVVGVFTAEGNCYGIGEISSLQQNNVLTVFADDPYTESVDGFADGEAMSFKIYRPLTGEEFDVAATFDPEQPNTGLFSEHGISVITGLKVSSTGTGILQYDAISLYPNPTDGKVKVSGIEDFNKMEIFNATGKLERTIDIDTNLEINLDISDLPAGFYQLRFTGNQHAVIKRLIRK